MEAKLKNYLSIAEKVTREITGIATAKKIPQYISGAISQALNDEVQYAFIDRTTNTIYESMHIDSNVKNILPFFMDKRFAQRISEMNWSVIDSKGVRFLFEEILDQEFDFDVSFQRGVVQTSITSQFSGEGRASRQLTRKRSTFCRLWLTPLSFEFLTSSTPLSGGKVETESSSARRLN
jgi:hypothetical protein